MIDYSGNSPKFRQHPLQLAVEAYLKGSKGQSGGFKTSSIDFPGFLTSCELNYHKFLCVFPGVLCEQTRTVEMHFKNRDSAALVLEVEERTQHTSKLFLSLIDQNAYLERAEMQIRVYHDMRVVEVLSVQSVDVRKSSIRRATNGVLRPSERLQASTLLSEWLGHCLEFGTVPLGALKLDPEQLGH